MKNIQSVHAEAVHVGGSGNNVTVNNALATAISTVNISYVNSFEELCKLITNKGKEDIQVLLDLTEQVKEALQEMNTKKNLDEFKKQSVWTKITNHMEKHGWFYGGILQLVGMALIS